MRVRNSPFGGSGGQPAAQPLAANSGGGDFFDNWDFKDPTAPSAASQPVQQPFGAAPQQPVQAPHMQQPQQFQQQQQQQQFQQQPQQFQQQQQFHQQQQQFQQQQQPQQFQQQQQQQQPQQFRQQPGQGFMSGGDASNFVGAGAAAMGLNEAMANVAFNQGMQQLQKSGVMGWFPHLFLSLQRLFAVGHSYVLRKLLVLLCPFIPSQQAQGSPEGFSPAASAINAPQQQGQVGADGLKSNIEEPDLYIPVMSYVTYVLIYGLQRGILKDFRPEVLPSTASFAMVLMVLEVGAAKMGFYVAGSPVPFVDLLANCSYKFVPVTMMVIARILTGGNPIYYVFFAYFAACAAWAARRFLMHFGPSGMEEQYGVAPTALRGHVILAITAAQLPLCWLLTPSAAGGKVLDPS